MMKLSLLIITVSALVTRFSSGSEVREMNNFCGIEETQSPYYIVIDGGSTGSRLHVFEFSEADDGCVCERRGSSRANVPLSDFAPDESRPLNASFVAAHMLPMFEFAATVLPPEFYNTTIVTYQATAGMRLLTEEQQEIVYDLLYEGLMAADSFVFRGMKREHLQTLSGDLEGYYGAVAANYLSGIIDTNLHVIDQESTNDDAATAQHPIGALDMGGSSTQIVYLTEQIDNGSHSCLNDHESTENASTDSGDYYPQTCSNPLDYNEGGKKSLQGEDFFSTSYLSYGVDQFRERLWNTLIMARFSENYSTSEDSCDTKIVEYPCGFEGHLIDYEGYTLVGTGDADECTRLVQRLLPHPEDATDDHHVHAGRTVGGIDHPRVTGKFFAMSLYFFTLDSLRVLSHPKTDAHEALNAAWPQPSIEELADALEGLCSRPWKGDLEEIQHNAHEFTRAAVLPHRCFESVYMVTLLRDGFGFHEKSRDITFTFLVDGSEVEWSLGMALALHSEVKVHGDTVKPMNARQEGDSSETNLTTSSEHRESHNNHQLPSSSVFPLAPMVTTSG